VAGIQALAGPWGHGDVVANRKERRSLHYAPSELRSR
jgi:hypothetical protein